MFFAMAETAISAAIQDGDRRRIRPGTGEARLARVDGDMLVADRESVHVWNPCPREIQPGELVGLEPTPGDGEQSMMRRPGRWSVVAVFD